MVNGRNYNINQIINDLYYHLQWRQTNFPTPALTDKTLKLLGSGCIYLFGRTKEYQPIMVIDMAVIGKLLAKKEIDPGSFCSLHNFFAQYITNNMLVPGQCEKWVSLVNIN